MPAQLNTKGDEKHPAGSTVAAAVLILSRCRRPCAPPSASDALYHLSALTGISGTAFCTYTRLRRGPTYTTIYCELEGSLSTLQRKKRLEPDLHACEGHCR
jgi:hypothetical protein